MRFARLMISNFKGITHIDLDKLGDTVVIAGPNGCGKSCIFDAIRLWKSAYGGYQQNEIGSWYNENGLSSGANGMLNTLQNKTQAMNIYADFQISDVERSWLRANVTTVLRSAAFRRRVPDYAWDWKQFSESVLDDRLRPHEPAVQSEVEREMPEFLRELELDTVPGSVTCMPDGNINIVPSIILSSLFSTYNPAHIGKFDYHGPQRTFGRENVGGVNLQIDQFAAQRQQSSLYNTSGKYNTVKTELASAYIRGLISSAASSTVGNQDKEPDLIETLKEMFETFFPGKRFLGVQPTESGSLTWNVRTAIGDHDLNELSSGEKELIYGYLRLKNEAPKNSIIMLDEPELHLNPRLTLGLPGFYHRHIGQALNNQLWLVTHSDSILRQSVGSDGFSVYHMQPAGSCNAEQQAVEVRPNESLERAIIDLVGDLATYKPNAKIVLLEGGGDSRFDEEVIRDLFPSFAERVNIVAGGSKGRVRAVQDILEHASVASTLAARIYSITDRDDDDLEQVSPRRVHMWDRYHIESYLLEEKYVLYALTDLKVSGYRDLTLKDVTSGLILSARDTLLDLVRHEIERKTYKKLASSIKISSSRSKPFSGESLKSLIEQSAKNFMNIVDTELSTSNIKSAVQKAINCREESLIDGTWKREFRGRDVLKRFIGTYRGVGYESFRNIIIARMRADGFQPVGMRTVVDLIDSDES